MRRARTGAFASEGPLVLGHGPDSSLHIARPADGELVSRSIGGQRMLREPPHDAGGVPSRIVRLVRTGEPAPRVQRVLAPDCVAAALLDKA